MNPKEIVWKSRFSLDNDTNVSLLLYKTTILLQKIWNIAHESYELLL